MIGDNEITKVFYSLAEDIFTHPKSTYYFEHSNPKELLKEASAVCLDRIYKYDSDKCKAMNFFVTIIGCYLRQSKAIYKNLKKLQEILRKED